MEMKQKSTSSRKESFRDKSRRSHHINKKITSPVENAYS